MFEFEFMQRAFIVGSILAILLPLVGLPVTLKRLSQMGDTLAHASLAGVAAGLCFGFHPLLGSVIACIIGVLSVQAISDKLPAYQEISTVVVLAFAIGCAGIFTGFAGNGAQVTSFLFGSIVTISDTEFYLVIVISALVCIAYRIIATRLYLATFDSVAAQFFGINECVLAFVFSLLVAASISLAAKTIGSLIVSSLLVIPTLCAMQLFRTYRSVLLGGIAFSLAFVYCGLCISYYGNLKPGSVIVLLAVVVLVITLVLKRKLS